MAAGTSAAFHPIRIFAAVAAAFCILGLAAVSQAAAKAPYKIGAIFSVTGPASFLGAPESKTAEMMQERINAAGGNGMDDSDIAHIVPGPQPPQED